MKKLGAALAGTSSALNDEQKVLAGCVGGSQEISLPFCKEFQVERD